MERAITLVALLCLSASLVCCQLIPICKDDVMKNRDDYQPASYTVDSVTKRRFCMFVEDNRFRGRNPISVTYYTCDNGYTRTRVSEDPSLFQCEMNSAGPTVATAPITLPRCPTGVGSYQKTYYVFSSIPLLELSRCSHGIIANGVPGTKISFIWVCPAGYTRQKAARGFYQCVKG